MNISIWASLKEARRMETLAPMLAQRPVLESAGVHFDAIANCLPLWSIETGWAGARQFVTEEQT